MITRRDILIGSAALSSGAARAADASSGAEAAGTLLTLREDASFVPAPGLAPTGVLGLFAVGGDPVIRLKPGAWLLISNQTQDRTGVGFVGLRGWGASDTAATLALQGIAPGTTQACTLKPGEAGTILVRATPSSGSEAQRGAAAVLLVEEAAAPAVDLDRALLLQDWLLGDDGQLRFGSTPPPDAVRRVVTVNRHAAPEQATLPPRARVRLRLLNGSTQRVMLVACEGMTPSVVAIDSQPCELFTPARGTVPIGPGARFDLLADLPDEPGRDVRVVLRGTERLAGALEPDQTLLAIRTDGPARDKRPPIVPLPPNPALPQAIPLEAARRLDLTFALDAKASNRWTVNGHAPDTRPVITVRQGDAVSFGLINDSALLVPIRLQGQAMRVLHARDDGWDPYWRDSVLLPPKSRTHVAFVADSPGRWAVESGFDDQLLAGLRCLYEVKPR